MKSYDNVYAEVGDGVGVGATDLICTQKLWSALLPIPNIAPPELRKRQFPLYVPVVVGAIKETEISIVLPGGTVPFVMDAEAGPLIASPL